MPSKSIYVKDETYRKIEQIAQTRGKPEGSIIADWVEIAAEKETTLEERPKSCGREGCEGTLQVHLSTGELGQLYLVCSGCGWLWNSKELYKTSLWRE